MFVPDDRLASLIFDYCRVAAVARSRRPRSPGREGRPRQGPGRRPRLAAAGSGRRAQCVRRASGAGRHLLRQPSLSCLHPGRSDQGIAAVRHGRVRSSLQGTSWLEAAGAVSAENQTLRLLADLAGLPSSAGGCFVSGGSAGNLSALVVARETGRRRLGGRGPARLRAAVSDQAHASIGKALQIIGMDALVVESDDHRLTGPAVAAALAADPDPASVVALVATAGTTNAGIIDDLAGLGEVAETHQLWFHVDGAYGGAALFAPSVRDRFAGIERADSFVVDPHKWLFAPFDCAALIYRHPQLARAVHTQDASYLDVLHTDAPDEWNPSDYAYHLTRRARGLALWFSLAVNGTDLYRDAVEAALDLARADRGSHRGDATISSCCASRSCPSSCSGGEAGVPRTTTPGRPSCSPTRSGS